MSRGAQTWLGRVNEDGIYSVLARVTALQGTGTQVRPEEGNCLKQADILSISCKVFSLGANKDNLAGTELLPAPSLSPADNIYDTLQTTGWRTGVDVYGYNFRHDVAASYTPSQAEWYRLEYKFTLTGGGAVWLRVLVKSVGLQSG